METITKILMTLIQDRQNAEMMTLFLVAGAVFFIIFGLLLLANSFVDPVRLRFLGKKHNTDFDVDELSIENNIYQKFSNIILPSNEELGNRTTLRLHHAGYHYRRTLYKYYSIRLLLMICLPILALIIMPFIPGIKLDNYIVVILIAWVIGFIGPSFVLDQKIKNRQKTIQRAFPDALDLLVVCSEAGLSLDASIQKVTSEIGFSHPVLAEEMNLLIAETRAGVERKKAFSGLATRTGVEDIRGLMSSLNQTMRFGSSIATTLRVYAEDFRDKRMQAAEEKAAKIGVKLIFPTSMCLLPCFLLLIVIPFGMNLMKVFSDLG